jgi:hypothetical protein
MTPPRWHRYALIAPFALFLLVMLVGGLVNRVDAHGRIIDDTSDTGIADVAVIYGSRSTATDAEGRFVIDNLPRGATLTTQHKYYGRNPMAATAAELRLVPLTITFEVKDATTGKGVDTPEARQPADTQVGKGTASGEMVVAPYPARDRPLLICAKDYKSAEVKPKGNLQDVTLTPAAGESCPPLKSPPPPPSPGTPSPTPKPSGSP